MIMYCAICFICPLSLPNPVSREEEEEATMLKLKNISSQYKVEKEARQDLEEEVAKMRRRMEAVDSLENLQIQNNALRRDLEESMFR